jgi:hypothetical protein
MISYLAVKRDVANMVALQTLPAHTCGLPQKNRWQTTGTYEEGQIKTEPTGSCLF